MRRTGVDSGSPSCARSSREPRSRLLSARSPCAGQEAPPRGRCRLSTSPTQRGREVHRSEGECVARGTPRRRRFSVPFRATSPSSRWAVGGYLWASPPGVPAMSLSTTEDLRLPARPPKCRGAGDQHAMGLTRTRILRLVSGPFHLVVASVGGTLAAMDRRADVERWLALRDRETGGGGRRSAAIAIYDQIGWIDAASTEAIRAFGIRLTRRSGRRWSGRRGSGSRSAAGAGSVNASRLWRHGHIPSPNGRFCLCPRNLIPRK